MPISPLNDNMLLQHLLGIEPKLSEPDPYSLINGIDPNTVDPNIVSGAQLGPSDKMQSLDFMPKVASPFARMYPGGARGGSPIANGALVGLFSRLMRLHQRLRDTEGPEDPVWDPVTKGGQFFWSPAPTGGTMEEFFGKRYGGNVDESLRFKRGIR